jgi:hypothetical protein
MDVFWTYVFPIWLQFDLGVLISGVLRVRLLNPCSHYNPVLNILSCRPWKECFQRSRGLRTLLRIWRRSTWWSLQGLGRQKEGKGYVKRVMMTMMIGEGITDREWAATNSRHGGQQQQQPKKHPEVGII